MGERRANERRKRYRTAEKKNVDTRRKKDLTKRERIICARMDNVRNRWQKKKKWKQLTMFFRIVRRSFYVWCVYVRLSACEIKGSYIGLYTCTSASIDTSMKTKSFEKRLFLYSKWYLWISLRVQMYSNRDQSWLDIDDNYIDIWLDRKRRKKYSKPLILFIVTEFECLSANCTNNFLCYFWVRHRCQITIAY